jgi:hypothetical protein
MKGITIISLSDIAEAFAEVHNAIAEAAGEAPLISRDDEIAALRARLSQVEAELAEANDLLELAESVFREVDDFFRLRETAGDLAGKPHA